MDRGSGEKLYTFSRRKFSEIVGQIELEQKKPARGARYRGDGGALFSAGGVWHRGPVPKEQG